MTTGLLKSVSAFAGGMVLLTVVACAPAVEETPGAESEVAVAGEVAPAANRSTAPDAATIERGRYLVTVAACNDCHTPLRLGAAGPEPDMSRMLSGHPEQLGALPPAPAVSGPWMMVGAGTATAYAGPWGVSYTANLTPDASGLGAWDEQMFVAAMRTGKHMGQSRPIMPPMPWSWIGQMTDQDLGAVWAYLRSIPPVVNHVPDPQLAVPPPQAMPAAEAEPAPTPAAGRTGA